MMRITLYLCTLVVLTPFLSWKPIPAPLTIVQGKVDNPKITAITLYGVAEGRKTEYATTRLSAGNSFALAVPELKEGFYYVTDNFKRDYHRIYLKPGDQLQLSFTEKEIRQQGGSPESKLVQQWNQLYDEVRAPAFDFTKRPNETYEMFFPLLTGFLPKAEAFKKQLATPNKGFNSLMKLVIDTDVEAAALQFIFTPRSKHPQPEDYPAYYNTIARKDKFCDGRMLQLGETDKLLSLYSTFCYLREKPDAKGAAMLQWNVSKICNDTLKGLFITNGLDRYRSFSNLREAIAPVEKYLLTAEQKSSYYAAEKKLRTFAEGEPGYNFAYEDIAGKNVAFKDLQGKVVLVDVWATWCGPCKAEIPHLKKLEEEMRGKDVVFLSVSVDEAKDKGKWMDFVKNEALGGTQLFASGWNDITKFYGITGIPRFMVFDKQGKIVNVDAPRPSAPELKALLEKTLTK